MSISLPVLWRYMAGQFFKVFLFTAVALIVGLLTLRLEEIASFVSLDPTGSYLLPFIAYQIPYILPIAIPLSSLISSMILMQRLSSTHEISAMRALGFSLTSIFSPLLITAFLCALLNFYITSEVATNTHLKTNLIKNELRAINPLLLLQNKHLLKTKGIFFDSLGSFKMGESASDVVIAFPGKEGAPLNLLIAKNLMTKGDYFSGENVTLLTSQSKKGGVVIENIGKTHSQVEDFSDLIKKKSTNLSDEHLSFRHLLLKLEEETPLPKTRNKIFSEIARRLSLGLAPLTFAFMGLSFGLSIGRRDSRKGLLIATFLATLFLTTFFLAKGASSRFITASLLYFTPHLLIILASLYNVRKISRGIE